MGFFGIWRGMGLDGDGMSEGSYMGSGTVDLFVMCVFVLVWCVLPGVRGVCSSRPQHCDDDGHQPLHRLDGQPPAPC